MAPPYRKPKKAQRIMPAMDNRFPEPDIALVRAIVAGQFPQWSGLEIRPVCVSGWDNRTFHLGDTLLVRLPSAAHYVAQVVKEQRWLPFLAKELPLPIPRPIACGAASNLFPFPWSIYQWLPGETLSSSPDVNQLSFATSLAHFLRALQAISTTDAPHPGPHCFYRGAHLKVYDVETQQAFVALVDDVDVSAASYVWNHALGSPYDEDPVWFHGDIAPGNLLINDGELCAVIDFGCCGVGDPACDVAIAWTDFDADGRASFLNQLGCDANMRSRAMGWALWKAMMTAVTCTKKGAPDWHRSMKTIQNVLDTA
jgi:aminoglycoside phosphotransferase (APT) family kinase protein